MIGQRQKSQSDRSQDCQRLHQSLGRLELQLLRPASTLENQVLFLNPPAKCVDPNNLQNLLQGINGKSSYQNPLQRLLDPLAHLLQLAAGFAPFRFRK